MRLPDEVRKELRQGKLVEFSWPSSASPPIVGRAYALSSAGGKAAVWHFRIYYAQRKDEGYEVAARIEPLLRLMPKKSQAGAGDYEDEDSLRVMRNGSEPEPEAVDEATQDIFSARAAHKDPRPIQRAEVELEVLAKQIDRLRRDYPVVDRARSGRLLREAVHKIDLARQHLKQRRQVA